MDTTTPLDDARTHAPPEERLQRMVETMKYDLKLATGSDQAGKNFADLIEASPYAKAQLLQAIEQGDLVGFSIGQPHTSPTYSPERKRISLDSGDLGALHLSESLFGNHVGILGHEARHAATHGARPNSIERLSQDYLERLHPEQARLGPDGKLRMPAMDLTQPIGNYIQAHRDSESRAELASFNAVSSMVQARNGGAMPQLAEIYRAAPDAIREYVTSDEHSRLTMKPGFVLGAGMMLEETPQNLKAMAKHYFDNDAPGARIGHTNGLDYRHYYAIVPLNFTLGMREAGNDRTTVPGQIHINMKALQLDEKRLEPYLNLRPGQSFTYYDTSSGKPVKSSFDGPAPKQEVAPGQDKAPGQLRPGTPGKGGKGPDPGEPDIGMHAAPDRSSTDPRAGLNDRQRSDLDRISGALDRDGRWDATSARNIAGDLLLQVVRDPSIQAVQRVAFSDPTPHARVFAMYSLSETQGPHFHVSVHGPTAAQRDANASLAQVAAINLEADGLRAREPALAQSADRAQSSPRMT